MIPTPVPRPFMDRFSERVSELTSTERVEGSHVRGLFREVTMRHTEEEAEEVFGVGLSATTPSINEVATTLPAPWVFTRLLGFLGIAFVAIWLGWKQWQAPNLLPGVILLGSFAAPMAICVFFFECNAPRNVSLFAIVRMFVWGGVLSLIATFVLHSFAGDWDDRIGAPFAGLTEEPAKLAAVVLLGSLPRYRWTLNGMCLGAAVGAGFAAFESAGFAMQILLAGGDDRMIENIAVRGVLAPLAHVVWTAISAGALWRVKGGRPFEFRMLFERRCLAPVVTVMILHALWNSEIPAWFPSISGYAILGVVAWTIVIGMLLGGLREVREATPVRP